MATTSKINGAMDSTLIAQVADSARQQLSAESKAVIEENTAVAPLAPQRQNTSDGVETLDLEKTRKIVARLQESMDRVAKEQHHVGFHEDPETNTYVIEIRNADGSVVKQFPPEKILNLMRKLDDLSGMVIDEMT